MLKAKIGMAVLAAAFAGTFSSSAEAFAPPTYACSAANEGSVAFTQMGRSKFEWVCSSNQWHFVLQYQCDKNGMNCIPL